MPVVAVQRNFMPDDYVVLSILTCLFCNWICGLVALIYSLQVNLSLHSYFDYFKRLKILVVILYY